MLRLKQGRASWACMSGVTDGNENDEDVEILVVGQNFWRN